MLIYKDIFTSDELCSDTFPVKLVDDLILEFTGKRVIRKHGEIQIAGFNASADEVEEGSEEVVERGIDIVLNHSLQDMTGIYGDVKVFKDWVKEYMKKLVEHMTAAGAKDEAIKDFKTKMQTWVGGLIKKEKFKNLEFFCGAGEDAAEGQLGILEHRDVDGVEKLIMMFVRAGLEEEKC